MTGPTYIRTRRAAAIAARYAGWRRIALGLLEQSGNVLSCRQLAAALGVVPATAMKVLRNLRAEGVTVHDPPRTARRSATSGSTRERVGAR